MKLNSRSVYLVVWFRLEIRTWTLSEVILIFLKILLPFLSYFTFKKESLISCLLILEQHVPSRLNFFHLRTPSASRTGETQKEGSKTPLQIFDRSHGARSI